MSSRAAVLQKITTFIHLTREYRRTGLLPLPSSRIFKMDPEHIGRILDDFPDIQYLHDAIVKHIPLALSLYPTTLGHHICLALFDAVQLPEICTLLRTCQTRIYDDAPHLPGNDDLHRAFRVRYALDEVVPLYMERAAMVTARAWTGEYPDAGGDPVFELGVDEAAVKRIERAFVRMWTVAAMFSGSGVDMGRVRNRQKPQRYDSENQAMFWSFMSRIPGGEIDILRGCIARITLEESWLVYVLQPNPAVDNQMMARRVGRNVRDLLFWSYDFGPLAVNLE